MWCPPCCNNPMSAMVKTWVMFSEKEMVIPNFPSWDGEDLTPFIPGFGLPYDWGYEHLHLDTSYFDVNYRGLPG